MACIGIVCEHGRSAQSRREQDGCGNSRRQQTNGVRTYFAILLQFLERKVVIARQGGPLDDKGIVRRMTLGSQVHRKRVAIHTMPETYGTERQNDKQQQHQ